MLNGVPMTVRLSSLMLVITHWMHIDMEWYGQATIYWLVVWNMNFIFPHIGNIHPIWLICFRGVETTNQFICVFPPRDKRNHWFSPGFSMSMLIEKKSSVTTGPANKHRSPPGLVLDKIYIYIIIYIYYDNIYTQYIYMYQHIYKIYIYTDIY